MRGYFTVHAFIGRHIRVIGYLGSSILVSVWTLIRFFNRQTIFDLVGQQILAGQWLHGHSSGANIGVTNYVAKMLVLYIPLDLLPGAPRLKLILLTIAVNIATIVLLGLVLEKILKQFNIQPRALFYGGLLWLSAIAGSVFWIHFTNSRNLEVAGGVFLLYLGIRYTQKPSSKLLVGLAGFASLLFFADTLQIYMIGVPLLLFALAKCIFKRKGYKNTLKLLLALGASVVVSKLLFVLTAHVFSLDYLQAQSTTPLSFAALTNGAIGTAHALAQLFSGAIDAGTVRMILNIGVLAAMVLGFVFIAWRRRVPRAFVALIAIVFMTSCAAYIASGQALQTDTSRYLIMTAPLAVLVLGSLDSVLKDKWRTVARSLLAATIVINIALLGLTLVKVWDTSFPKDAHLESVRKYLIEHPNAVSYASMDTAIPLSFLDSSHAPLPLECTQQGLIKNRTFYDQGAFLAKQRQNSAVVLIVLDSDASIHNTPYICTQSMVLMQLGQPVATDVTDDGSIVLRYRPAELSLPNTFN